MKILYFSKLFEMKIKFYEDINDDLIKFAVIVAKFNDKFVFCKHKNRSTYELPGGHREKGEDILEAAKRELYEETGATKYTIKPVCFYSVIGNDGIIECRNETYGALFYVEILELGHKLYNEIEKIELFEEIPLHNQMTYPIMHTALINKIFNDR